jgi:hypothetical protein
VFEFFYPLWPAGFLEYLLGRGGLGQVDGFSVEVGYDRFMVTAKIGAEKISGVERKSR